MLEEIQRNFIINLRFLRKKKEYTQQEIADRYAYEEWFSYWTNFNKMKKHFIDNNKSIEILEVL